MKLILTFWYGLILFACSETAAQIPARKIDYIIYELPKAVTDNASSYILQCNKAGSKSKFVAMIAKNLSDEYTLSILQTDTTSRNNSDILLQSKLINVTNRLVRLNGLASLPLIFDDDFKFAVLGTITYPNGRVGKQQVRFENDSYSIVFDYYGKIKK